MGQTEAAGLSRSLARVGSAPIRSVLNLGDQVGFYLKVYRSIPSTITKYPKETIRLVTEVSLGSGAMAAVGGTVFVVFALSIAIGIEVGLEAYTTFGNIGVSSLSGFFAAYFNTREAAPIMACIGLTATVGAGFTAQLGAMRVAEEIDALEVMAVPSIPFLVTTRVLAGLVAVVPLYAVGVVTMYVATQLLVTLAYGQAIGTYQHYFDAFFVPADLLLSIVKVLITSVAIMSVCCFSGFNASGGPAGVGRAVGQAVRTSLIVIMVIDMGFGFAFWGVPTVNISG